MPCLRSGVPAPLHFWPLLGPLAVISALCLLMEVFFWNRFLPLVLWLWHWSTVVCKRQYIIAPGARPAPVSSFLEGFCVSWEMKPVQHLLPPQRFQKALGPVLLFRFLRVGEGHENCQQGQLPLSVKTGATWLSCHIFLNIGFWGTFLKSGFTHQTGFMKNMNNLSLTELL